MERRTFMKAVVAAGVAVVAFALCALFLVLASRANRRTRGGSHTSSTNTDWSTPVYYTGDMGDSGGHHHGGHDAG